MEAKFCMSCGASLEPRVIDGETRLGCTACSYVHWGNYSIGVGALVERDGKYLLVRRAQNPGMGNWTNPGGYIEQLELFHKTIEREVLEEAGIEAVVSRIVAVRDQPRSIHNLYVAFAMEYVSGEPTPDNYEVDAAGFFSMEEIEGMKVANFTRWLLDVAKNGKTVGLDLDNEPCVPLEGCVLFRV